MRKFQYLFLILLLVMVGSCSHKFDSNTLGLDFYQWNLWQDTETEKGNDLPSCGWDDLHRGKGMLVRIPASLDRYFQNEEGAFELDVTEVIYYTRDNHLSIRVSSSEEGTPGKINGITGNIRVKVNID